MLDREKWFSKFRDYVKTVAKHNYEEYGGLEDSYVDEAIKLIEDFENEMDKEKWRHFTWRQRG